MAALDAWPAPPERKMSGIEGYFAELFGAGLGVAQDYAQAMSWYRKAADQGDAHAQALLKELSP